MEFAALFPGQGSQSVGMGKDFFNQNELAKELFASADKALGYSISNLCFDGPIEELTLTKNTQPALLVASYIAYKLSELKPKTAAGHSLGEYTALVAADCLKFEDAVQLVHKRGTYMQEAVPKGIGKMAAIMGPSEEEINSYITDVSSGLVQIANLNSPGQTVIAGDNEGVDNFVKLAGEKGAKAIPLNVSAPFHCSLMQPAAENLAKDLDATTFNDPQFPVYANFTSEAVNKGNTARELLKEQVCGSVRWTSSMQNMIKEQSVEKVIEFGPGGVLSKLMKRIDKSIGRAEVFDSESLGRVVE